MIPGSFTYHAPSSVEEAVALLGQLGDDAKVLAGGHSLIPAMRFRLAAPEALVDLGRIDRLRYIREEDGHLCIGAMTRESDLEASDVVAARYPLLGDTTAVVADPLVRNMGTLGGNLAHSDPANDHPATMLAYDAVLVALGPDGSRTIAIDDFFTGLFETALAPNEILTEIRIPAPGAGAGGAYVKLERKVGDYAISAVAVQLTMDGGTCSAARIGLTNVSPVPMRATDAEAALVGQPVTPEVLEATGQAAAAQCDPAADLRGSEAYKRDITRVLTKRAVQRAAERAGGTS
ncbi:MAG: xanthine dehydrogenase family protein subunit M [Acidobacteria bacterium]|nr:xanthine dehydrogenase family protein subunit M [Acidobacteriota bacterium]NIT10385.1 xanthine dehydrogenase family protein subunit M [Acidobacteriota bacterium]